MSAKISGLGKGFYSILDDGEKKTTEQQEMAKIQTLEKERASLTQKIEALDKERVTHTKRLEAIDAELEKLKAEALANKKARLEAEYASIEERKKEIADELAAMKNSVNEQ